MKEKLGENSTESLGFIIIVFFIYIYMYNFASRSNLSFSPAFMFLSEKNKQKKKWGQTAEGNQLFSSWVRPFILIVRFL